jgi:hypothetical protein
MCQTLSFILEVISKAFVIFMWLFNMCWNWLTNVMGYFVGTYYQSSWTMCPCCWRYGTHFQSFSLQKYKDISCVLWIELHLQRCNMKIFTFSKCCDDIANSKFDTIWNNIENQMQTQMVEDWATTFNNYGLRVTNLSNSSRSIVVKCNYSIFSMLHSSRRFNISWDLLLISKCSNFYDFRRFTFCLWE